MKYSQDSKEASELVIAIIGPIGCNRKLVINTIKKLAEHYKYKFEEVSVSRLIAARVKMPNSQNEFERVSNLMQAGNALREKSEDNSILAKLAASHIASLRKRHCDARVIYIIDSLKHPDEVNELKNVYGRGFYLFAIHSSENSRRDYLENQCLISDEDQRENLIQRDKDEKIGHGQSTSEAFHLADFFLTENGNQEKVWNSTQRFMDIIFGDPFRTPTFHEYAMFMAYASAIRSSDMSRQVGALIAHGTDIISTGANECPKAFGGTYWPLFNENKNLIYDVENGRDYMKGFDYNAKEKYMMVDCLKKGIPESILKTLLNNIEDSGLNDLTEYGRVVHAEMDAILGCARRGVSCERAVIFCTTFPCHNCAKHILASGIKQVVFIEPYPKSKALEMHSDALEQNENHNNEKVVFTPFVGVGPRQFVNFFSMSLSVGEKIRRKKKGGYEREEWSRNNARPRVKMYPVSYVDNEKSVKAEASRLLKKIGNLVID